MVWWGVGVHDGAMLGPFKNINNRQEGIMTPQFRDLVLGPTWIHFA